MSFLLVPMLLAGVLFDVAFTLAAPRWSPASAMTQPHRGHLYQVAHRSGMDAREHVAVDALGRSPPFGGLVLHWRSRARRRAQAVAAAALLAAAARLAGLVVRLRARAPVSAAGRGHAAQQPRARDQEHHDHRHAGALAADSGGGHAERQRPEERR